MSYEMYTNPQGFIEELLPFAEKLLQQEQAQAKALVNTYCKLVFAVGEVYKDQAESLRGQISSLEIEYIQAVNAKRTQIKQNWLRAGIDLDSPTESPKDQAVRIAKEEIKKREEEARFDSLLRRPMMSASEARGFNSVHSVYTPANSNFLNSGKPKPTKKGNKPETKVQDVNVMNKKALKAATKAARKRMAEIASRKVWAKATADVDPVKALQGAKTAQQKKAAVKAARRAGYLVDDQGCLMSPERKAQADADKAEAKAKYAELEKAQAEAKAEAKAKAKAEAKAKAKKRAPKSAKKGKQKNKASKAQNSNSVSSSNTIGTAQPNVQPVAKSKEVDPNFLNKLASFLDKANAEQTIIAKSGNVVGVITNNKK